MPFAGFENFSACVAAQEKKGKSNESARRICGALMQRFEKSADLSETEKHPLKSFAERGGAACLSLDALTESEKKEYAKVVAGLDDLDDSEIDILTDGDLAKVLQKYAIDPNDPDEENEITECFITGDDDMVMSSADVLAAWTRRSMKSMGEQRMVTQKDAMRDDARAVDIAQRESAQAVSTLKQTVSKTAVGTTQQQAELGQSRISHDTMQLEIVEPPYPPELLAAFLEVDEVHFRCVRTKVTDSVGRDFQIVPTVTVRPDENLNEEGRDIKDKDGIPPIPAMPHGAADIVIGPDRTGLEPGTAATAMAGSAGLGAANRASNGQVAPLRRNKRLGSFRGFMDMAKSALGMNGSITKRGKQTSRKSIVSQDEIDDEVQIVEDFISDANEILGFEGVIDRACMDYEGIGWGAIEVIRSANMKVARIAHVPAVRVRVLKGWKGFVEIVSHDRSDGSNVSGGKYVYYQNFNQKIMSKRKHPITGMLLPFDPAMDGELSPMTATWNLVDRDTGMPMEPSAENLARAANEILWIPRHHANTIYYGYTDVVPALGWLLANVHIRDYLLQFFEHNTVPRYAIIIEGAKLAEPVKKAITQYFSTQVKGKAHKTLIIPIPSMRGEVKVRFEKLDADANEGSFQETKKNNAQAIMTAHGVSPAIIGIAEASELGSGKGLSQAEIYKDRIVTPSQRYWARKLNRMFNRGLGVNLVAIKFNPLDIRDEKAEMEVLTGYLKVGVTTINAIRKRTGTGPPIPGGGRAFIVMGNTIMFVDELTEASSTEREELLGEVESLQGDMKMQQMGIEKKEQDAAVKEKEKVDAQSAKAAAGAKAGPGQRSSVGAQTNPTKVGGTGGGTGGKAAGGKGTPAKAKQAAT